MAIKRITEANFRKSNISELIVDPGFVNARKIDAILEEGGREVINSEIEKLAFHTPIWRREIAIYHIYSQILLDFCSSLDIRSVQENILTRSGHLMCSIVQFLPSKDVLEKERAISKLELIGYSENEIELHYSTNKILSDTLKSGLTEGGEFALIAEFHRMTRDKIILHPLLIGYPYLKSKANGNLSWKKYSDFYQVYIDDFKEFEKVIGIDPPKDLTPMKQIKESVFKLCLAKILGDTAGKDWGGETSDYFSTHMNLGNQRISAAFLLKGPANFRPMNLNHLGKNNDQIVRLAKEPVDVLVVQHSHDILLPVRETLKVFAIQPSNPRRYCLIDGRDSLRILEAYNLLDWAVAESNKSK